MDGKALFKKRFKGHIKSVMRYAQYILNGHIAIALIFLVVALAVIYQQFILNLPDAFPVSLVMSLILSLVILYNPIQTFTKEADLVFLLPAKTQLMGFFYRGLVYSFVIQSYLMVLTLAALSPLYHARFISGNYLLIILLFFIFKIWHFILNWVSLRFRNRVFLIYTKWWGFAIQLMVWYTYLNDWTVLFIVTLLCLFLTMGYIFHESSKYTLALDGLIINDQHRMERFYRLASLFTDVRELSTRVKKRRLLSHLITSRIPVKQHQTYTYLYRLTFSRSQDYLGLYSRLIMIGSMILYVIEQPFFSLGVGLLFVYLIGIQLLPLFSHHDTKLWLILYPTDKVEKKQAFLKQLILLLGLVVIVFSAIIAMRYTLIDALLFIFLASVFSYGFVYIYGDRKISNRAFWF